MNWFFEKSIRTSEINGEICLLRRLGRWQVLVNGVQQSGDEMIRIWGDAVKRIKSKIPNKDYLEILVLGLGAGGALKMLYKQFPNCNITAVEYDPVMISLTKEIGQLSPYPLPRVIEGDAGEIVSTLDKSFDVIIIDLFHGAEPSPLLLDNDFLNALRNKTTHDGIILVNAYLSQKYLDNIDNYFPQKERWICGHNHLAAYYNK